MPMPYYLLRHITSSVTHFSSPLKAPSSGSYRASSRIIGRAPSRFAILSCDGVFSPVERQRGLAVDFRAVFITGSVTKVFQGRWEICFELL
ncbi:hypothetical protein SDJN03_02903, partial [Cucurbita argyrosperma subsp. sororia]